MPRDGSDEVADLWAMAAEMERQFAAYKQRLAERHGSAHAAAGDDDDDASGGGGGEEEEKVKPCGGDSSGDVRGRRYEAYVRRRDERLRQGWRARMERKEAEVKAFWAQLELSGRRAGGNSSGGRSSTSGAGDEEVQGKTERNDQDKKRSSEAALAQTRISGKKYARTRSFSSSTTNTSTSHPDDVGGRRALSQEPPPSEPHVPADTSKESRARRAVGAAKTTTTATSRPKTSSRRKNSVKGHGSAKQTGPKLPRSLPRRASSGGHEDLISKEVVLPTTADAGAPLLRRSYEQDVHGEVPEASPSRPSTSIGIRDDGADQAQHTASPGSARSEVVDVVPSDGKPEAKNADTKKHHDEVDDASPDKADDPNGEITSCSDSDIEPNYVYINKDIVKEQAMSLPETQAASVAVPADFSAKTSQDNAETTAPIAAVTATGISTTNAKEAPARESSGDSSSSGRSGRSPPSSAKTSCSSRDQSIERVLEADAALLRKMREKQRTQKSAPKTPGSAGSRVSGTARSSPKETPKGFKRFLSFGKKNRDREVTVIDCTSPSVSSVADDDSERWQSAGSIKPRLGTSDAACSDGTDHARTTSPRACSLQSLVAASPAKSELAEIAPQGKSPKAHRPFFSFRSLNCGRG